MNNINNKIIFKDFNNFRKKSIGLNKLLVPIIVILYFKYIFFIS